MNGNRLDIPLIKLFFIFHLVPGLFVDIFEIADEKLPVVQCMDKFKISLTTTVEVNFSSLQSCN